MKLKSRNLECFLLGSLLVFLFLVKSSHSSLFSKFLSGLSKHSGIEKKEHLQIYQETKPRHQQIPQNDEQRLLQDLMRCYDKSIRPADRQKNKVMVKFHLKPIQIVDLNEKKQQVTLNVWVTQTWRNDALTWDPAHYGGIDVINVDSSLVWTPEILLYNNAEEKFSGGKHKYKTKIIMGHNGNQTWYSTTFFTSTCKINVERFPFDDQKCELKFGPWSHDSQSIDMEADEPEDISNYMLNGEWDLVSFLAVKRYTLYRCCKVPFADITFTLHIRRKTLYYFYALVVPCSVITLLITLAFYVPPASGQRVTLCVTLLFSMTVFLNVANNKLPVTSDQVPLIAKLFMAYILQMILSTASSCIVLYCYHRNYGSCFCMWFMEVFVPKLANLLYVNKGRKTAAVALQTKNAEASYSDHSVTDDTVDFKILDTQSTCETLNSIPALGNSTDSFAVELPEADRKYLTLYRTMAPFRRWLYLPPPGEKSEIRDRHRKTQGIKSLVDHVKRKKLKVQHEVQRDFVARVLDRLSILGFFVILIISVIIIWNA